MDYPFSELNTILHIDNCNFKNNQFIEMIDKRTIIHCGFKNPKELQEMRKAMRMAQLYYNLIHNQN